MIAAAQALSGLPDIDLLEEVKTNTHTRVKEAGTREGIQPLRMWLRSGGRRSLKERGCT